MPGTLPALRRRRLAPVPCASRLLALISIAMSLLLSRLTLSCAGPATRHRRIGKLFYEERTYRLFRVNPEDRLRDQPGDRQLPDLLAGARVIAQRDGVGDHQFVHVRAGDLVDRAAREDGVRAIGDHLGRALLLQHLRRL